MSVGIMHGAPAKKDEFMDLVRLLADPEELERRKAGYQEAKDAAETAHKIARESQAESDNRLERIEEQLRNIKSREADIKATSVRQESLERHLVDETNRLERMAQHYRSEEARLGAIQAAQNTAGGEIEATHTALYVREEKLKQAEAAHHARVAQIEAKIGRVNQAWNS